VRGIIEYEAVRHLVSGDVENFYAAVVVGRDIDGLFVLRKAQSMRKTGLHLDAVSDLARGFVDDKDPIGVCAAKKSAGDCRGGESEERE
jgi:hypothetical protein